MKIKGYDFRIQGNKFNRDTKRLNFQITCNKKPRHIGLGSKV